MSKGSNNSKSPISAVGKKRSGKRDVGGGRQANKLGSKKSAMGPYS